jgi:hypothetical protein
MGMAKQHLLEREDKLQSALRIAEIAGLVGRCDVHEVYFDLLDDEQLEHAYRLANKLVSEGDPLVAVFDGDRRELTNFVRDCRSEIGMDCPGCKAFFEDDDEPD